MFLDEITSLLLSYPTNKLTLDKLSAKYYNTFNKQINFKQLKYDSLLEAVRNLPNVKVWNYCSCVHVYMYMYMYFI